MAPRSEAYAVRTVDTDNLTLTFQFKDRPVKTVALDDLTLDIQKRLALHGLGQKLGDSYSGAKTQAEEEGRDAAEVAFENFNDTLDQLLAGEWAVRAAGESRAANDLVAAMNRVRGDKGALSPEQEATVRKMVSDAAYPGKDADDSAKKEAATARKALRDFKAKNPAIARALNELEAERIAKRADVAAPTGGLNDML